MERDKANGVKHLLTYVECKKKKIKKKNWPASVAIKEVQEIVKSQIHKNNISENE